MIPESNPNKEQQKAIESLEGTALFAGAGAGKTFVLTQHLLFYTKKFPQHRVVVITFTIKAAEEIKRRVQKILSPEVCERLHISTLDSFFYSLLREIPSYQGIQITSGGEYEKKVEKIYETFLEKTPYSDQTRVFFSHKERIVPSLIKWKESGEKGSTSSPSCDLPTILKHLNLPLDLFQVEKALPPTLPEMIHFIQTNRFSSSKTSPYRAEFRLFWGWIKKYGEELSSFLSSQEHALLYKKEYRTLKKEIFSGLHQEGFYTYKDVEELLLQNLPEHNFQYFIIDEFQDTSSTQFELIKDLIGEDFKKLYLVGDPKQSIYRFRGGHSSVFEKASEKLTKLFLTTNYRSFPEIVAFNNTLFQDTQTAHTSTSKGVIYELAWEGEQENPQEEKLILEHTLFLLSQKETGICILAKRNTDLKNLIHEFFKRGIPFSSQVKVTKEEHPLFILFQLFLETLLGQDDPRILKKIIFHAKTLFPESSIKINPVTLQKNLETFGTYSSFLTFLESLPLSIPPLHALLEALKSMIEDSQGNLEKIWSSLKKTLKEPLLLPLATTHHPRVTLSTIHSSKGLEFNHVLLMGLAKIPRSKSDNSFWGRGLDSFSFPDPKGDIIKNFSFILEKEREKELDAQEDQRLFYVATTRAIKSLSFAHSPEKKVHPWKEKILQEIRPEMRTLKKYPPSKDFAPSSPNAFYLFNLTPPKSEVSSTSFLMPEVSVTKLSDLVVCPRYFYLKNILKIKAPAPPPSSPPSPHTSTAPRGLEVHQKIEAFIKGHSRGEELSSWVKKRLKNLEKDYKLQAEVPLRFELKGQMISGVVDLYAKPRGKRPPLIIDYKTGGHPQEVLEGKYFFQTLLYAYALAEKTAPLVLLEIWYVDLETFSHYEVTREDMQKVNSFYWSKMLNYSERKTVHCPHCSMKPFCY